jgi:hypothetical protein
MSWAHLAKLAAARLRTGAGSAKAVSGGISRCEDTHPARVCLDQRPSPQVGDSDPEWDSIPGRPCSAPLSPRLYHEAVRKALVALWEAALQSPRALEHDGGPAADMRTAPAAGRPCFTPSIDRLRMRPGGALWEG